MSLTKILCAVSFVLLVFGAGAVMADPYCQACPFSCADVGLGRKDCGELREARGLCCLDLTSRGLEIAREQERVLGSRAPQQAPARTAVCPSGFTRSERSCSKEERRRGCRDIRQNDGTGCVDSRFR